MKKATVICALCASIFGSVAQAATTWTAWVAPPTFQSAPTPTPTAIYETNDISNQGLSTLVASLNDGVFVGGLLNGTDLNGFTSTNTFDCSSCTSSFSSANAFNYAIIHVGNSNTDPDKNQDLLLYWANAINSFTFSLKGVSTITAFTTDGGGHQNEVPLPGAVWLLGSALLGYMGLSRRKNNLAV